MKDFLDPIGIPELMLIVVAVLLIFGVKKLPSIISWKSKRRREFEKAREDFEKEITRAGTDVRVMQAMAHQITKDRQPTKDIPAPEKEREGLVKRLFLARCEGDPRIAMMALAAGINLQEVSEQLLMQGSLEAMILRIVEEFLAMCDQGATEEFAVKTLNQSHSAKMGIAGKNLPVLQQASSLFQYVRHFVDALDSHHGVAPISDHFIIDAIQEVKSYYNR